MTLINVVDRSTLLDDVDFLVAFEACKKQLLEHVTCVWKRGDVEIVANGPDDVGYQVVVLDDPDQAGFLGYHTKTPTGLVWARVFVRPIVAKNSDMLKGSLSVSAIMSHEIIEAYCDPDVNLWARRPDGKLVAYEAVDPVEADFYDVQVGDRSVSVSNFVTPAWFDVNAPRGSKFDKMETIQKPFGVSKGGYVVVLDPRTGGTKNVFGSRDAVSVHAARQSPSSAARSRRKIFEDQEVVDEVFDE